MTAEEYIQLQGLTDEIVAETEANDNLQELIRAHRNELERLELEISVFDVEAEIDALERRVALYNIDEEAFLLECVESDTSERAEHLEKLRRVYFAILELMDLREDVEKCENQFQISNDLVKGEQEMEQKELDSFALKRDHLRAEAEFCQSSAFVKDTSNAQTADFEFESQNIDSANELEELKCEEEIILEASIYKRHIAAIASVRRQVSSLRRSIISELCEEEANDEEFETRKVFIEAEFDELALSIDKTEFLEAELFKKYASSYETAMMAYSADRH